MAANPIKFRCYRCNQMLGISPSKVGARISCPKCQAMLVVPDPPASPSTPPASQSGISTNPLDAWVDINPEDIRAEPGAFSAPREPDDEPPPDSEPASEPSDPEWELAVEDVPPEPESSPVEAAESASDRPPAEEPVIPPIEVNSPRPRGGRAPLARASDVVLPRSVVLVWSLFVLSALALAFGAGLLAGHYIWRVH